MQIAGYFFRPEWKTSVLVALLLPLLTGLGFWQLDREQEKLEILADYRARSAASPASLNVAASWQQLGGANDASFRRVTVRGRLLDHPLILLDNKTRNGVAGFQVVQGIELSEANDGGSSALNRRRAWLNRGWVAGGRLRSEPPKVDTPTGLIEVLAQVYVPLGKPFVLANETLSVDAFGPIIAQQIDMAELAATFPEVNTFPHLLRLEPESRAAFSIDWPAVNTRPEKHRGYAIQWFAMALALVVFYVLRSLEKDTRSE